MRIAAYLLGLGTGASLLAAATISMPEDARAVPAAPDRATQAEVPMTPSLPRK